MAISTLNTRKGCASQCVAKRKTKTAQKPTSRQPPHYHHHFNL